MYGLNDMDEVLIHCVLLHATQDIEGGWVYNPWDAIPQHQRSIQASIGREKPTVCNDHAFIIIVAAIMWIFDSLNGLCNCCSQPYNANLDLCLILLYLKI